MLLQGETIGIGAQNVTFRTAKRYLSLHKPEHCNKRKP